jgi:hypothetical protein
MAKNCNKRVNFARVARLVESRGMPMDQRIQKRGKEMEEG